jgi:microcystin degradation protein MlrC
MNEGLNLATEELKLAYAKVGVDLNEALAQYALDFADAMTEAKTDLTDTLAELQKDLNRDLAEMQDAFHVAMAEINKDIQATINQIFALIAAISALGGLTSSGIKGGKTDSVSTLEMFKNKEKKFATGGIVTGPTHALIGEAGPEAVIPLDKIGKIGGTVNISIQNTNTQSDQDTANAILRAMRFGQVVQVSGGVLNI